MSNIIQFPDKRADEDYYDWTAFDQRLKQKAVEQREAKALNLRWTIAGSVGVIVSFCFTPIAGVLVGWLACAVIKNHQQLVGTIRKLETN